MTPATDERLTIEPPVSFIARTASRQPKKRALGVDRVDLAPVGERRRLDIAENADAGAVDEDVEAAKCGDDRVDHRAPARFVGHVLHEHEIGVRPKRLEARLVAVGRGDLGALAMEQRRRRPADARGRAGDQRDLAGETPRFCPLHRSLARSK